MSEDAEQDASPPPTGAWGKFTAWTKAVGVPWAALASIGLILGAGFGAAGAISALATRDDVESIREELEAAAELRREALSEDIDSVDARREALANANDELEVRLIQHIASADEKLSTLDKSAISTAERIDTLLMEVSLTRLSIEQRQANSYAERQAIRRDAATIRQELMQHRSEPKSDSE